MFKRKQSKSFFDYLIDQSIAVKDAVQALYDFCTDPTTEKGDFVRESEETADAARAALITEINNSFFTPIDREDLFTLSSSIDDLADYAWTTVKDLRIYDIDPDENLRDLVEILLEMSEVLIECMRNLEKSRSIVNEKAIKVKKLENKLNTQFHTSISTLFESDDFKQILKYREIYSHMNHAAAKGDHCADILQNIIVKM